MRPTMLSSLVLACMLLCACAVPAEEPGSVAVIVGATSSAPAVESMAYFGLAASAGALARRTFTYQSMNSASAIESITNDETFFAVTDYPPTDSGLEYIIAGSQSFAVTCNVEGIDQALTLSRETLVDLFMGKIATWDDPAIVSSNSGVFLPNIPVELVYRSDPCGTTRMLTRMLSRFSDDWRTQYGEVDVFPADIANSMLSIGTDSSEKMLASLRTVRGGFTFIGFSHLVYTEFVDRYFRVPNQAGNLLRLNEATLSFAEGIDDPMDNSDPNAWPMVGNVYVLYKTSYNIDLNQCTPLLEALDMFGVVYGVQISTDIAASLLTRVWGPVSSDIINTPIWSGEILCGGGSLADVPPPVYPSVSVYLPSDIMLEEETYELQSIQSRAPFFDSIGQTIEENEADTFELPPYSGGTYIGDNEESSSGHALRVNTFLFSSLLAIVAMVSSPRVALSILVCFAIVATLPTANARQINPPETVRFVALMDFSSQNAALAAEEYSAMLVASDNINANSDILPDTTIEIIAVDVKSNLFTSALSTLRAVLNGGDVIIGPRDSDIAAAVTIVSTLYDVPIVSYGARGSDLDSAAYQTFTRVVPASTAEAFALASIIARYDMGEFGVTVISASDTDGISSAQEFLLSAADLQFEVTASLTVANGAQLSSIIPVVSAARDTKARIFVCFLDGAIMRTVLKVADEFGLVNDNYLWLGDSRVQETELMLTTDENGNSVEDPEMRQLLRGFVSTSLRFSDSGNGKYAAFLEQWQSLDPSVYFNAGNEPSSLYTPYAYDAVELAARAFDSMYREQLAELSAATVVSEMKTQSFFGLSGDINLRGQNSNRATLSILNFVEGEGYRGFKEIGLWREDDDEDHQFVDDDDSYGFTFSENIIFHSGTTQLPDLDIRNPLDYWSCKDKKAKTDESGKEIRLDEPGRSADYIADFYECDGFIDCYNMSDEWECPSSLPIGFIVVGVIIAILLLVYIILLLIIIGLSTVKREARIAKSHPILMVAIIIACMFILLSIFTVYGQPHDVSCVLQPWLMILPVAFLIPLICIRPIAIYHHFKFPNQPELQGWHMVIVALLLTLPVIFLLMLWTIISTPSATLEEVDDQYHHVCGSNGFAGAAGGYVFFALILAYEIIILITGAIVSAMARKVIVAFNESRLIATVIYNTGLVGAVGIPIYFVLSSNNVARWSILVGCLLYISLSTVVILFVPKLYGLVFVDPGKKKQAKELGVSSGSASGANDNDLF